MIRAQTTVIDFLFGVLLLIVAGVLVSTFVLTEDRTPAIYAEAQILAGSIFSPYPPDWNQSTVIVPGFVYNHRFNETQFYVFENISTLKQDIGFFSEYFVNTSIGSIGTPPAADAEDIASIIRYAAYNGSIMPVEVIVWTPEQ